MYFAVHSKLRSEKSAKTAVCIKVQLKKSGIFCGTSCRRNKYIEQICSTKPSMTGTFLAIMQLVGQYNYEHSEKVQYLCTCPETYTAK